MDFILPFLVLIPIYDTFIFYKNINHELEMFYFSGEERKAGWGQGGGGCTFGSDMVRGVGGVKCEF